MKLMIPAINKASIKIQLINWNSRKEQLNSILIDLSFISCY